jgi:uncharacterized membrane protein YfcA
MLQAVFGVPLELWVLLAIAVGAFAQAVTGMGFALIAAPVLIAAIGQAQGVATVLVLASIASIIPLARGGWRDADPRAAGRLLVPTLIATPVFGWALHAVSHDVLAVAGGLAVLVGVALLGSGLRSAWLRTRGGTVAMGIASAGLNVVGGVGGPPVGLYAANSDWEPARTRGTLQAFFLVQNVATAFVVGLVLPSWPQVAALVLGSVLGLVVTPRLPLPAARMGVLGVSALGGIALVAGST